MTAGGEGRRGVTIAVLSTIVFFTVLALAITHAPGWPEVRQTFFNWQEFKASMPEIARAFLLNVKIFLISEAFILPLRARAGCHSQPARAGVLPAARARHRLRGLLPRRADDPRDRSARVRRPALQLSWVPLSTTFWGIVALTLVYTAYVSEVYRAGIESVHPSQNAAARSLGLSHWQSLQKVVLPQAVRRVIPPLLNDFIGLQKDTALVGFLGSVEAFKQSQIDAAATFNYTPFVAAAVSSSL